MDALDGTGSLATLVDRVPPGWSRVTYQGRPYGLTRSEHAEERSTSIFAEELGGTDVVSTNVWRTARGLVLRPCEMPAEHVLAFLAGWTAEAAAP